MTVKRVTVRHPAGIIKIDDDGRPLEVDLALAKHAVGSLIHARSPLMAPGDCGEAGHAHEEHCDRHQVGTATLITYRTELDGSAVDLEWELEFPDPEPPAPDPSERDFIRGDGVRETWTCERPPGAYIVVREEWSADGQRRLIHETRPV